MSQFDTGVPHSARVCDFLQFTRDEAEAGGASPDVLWAGIARKP
jgi:hypothetical protein